MSDWKATGRTFRYWQAGEKPLWNNLYRLLGSCVTHADYIFQFWFDVVKDNMKQPLKKHIQIVEWSIYSIGTIFSWNWCSKYVLHIKTISIL